MRSQIKLLLLAFFTLFLSACESKGTSVNIDTTPPITPFNISISSVVNGPLTVSGVAESNSNLTVTYPDGAKQITTTNSEGKFSQTSTTSSLNDGNVTITSKDDAGNSSNTVLFFYVAPKPPVPQTTVTALGNGTVTVTGIFGPNAIVTATFSDGYQQSTIADSNGDYSLTSLTPQTTGNIKISADAVLAYVDSTAPELPTSTVVTATNDNSFIISGTAEMGSTVTASFPDGLQQSVVVDSNGRYSLQSPPNQPINQPTDQPNDQITLTSKDIAENESNRVTTTLVTALSFVPSLGINTEQPQGGSDAVAVPMPFVDIFRTARPFKEFSGNIITDSNGWVTTTDVVAGRNYAKTKLLQGTLNHSIPSGTYTILYEGDGYVEFGTGGPVSNHVRSLRDHEDTIDLVLKDAVTPETNAINMNIKGISAGDAKYLKNIRIIMPGGTCAGNPFTRVESAVDCPSNSTFESFSERLRKDRNAIIFNPDYLTFMREYKVLRMMNLMEASLKHTCKSEASCPASLGTWDDRATMDDAIWGGSDDPARTPYADHKGVALEVVVALANAVNRDIWINIPHFAKDDYISNAASYVKTNLNPDLKVYIEFSNEVWNSGFAGYDYLTGKGIEEGLGTVPQKYIGTNRDDPNYFARLRYFSKRSVEIFDIWESAFDNSTSRLKRILGSFIGDKILTEQMIHYVTTEIGQNKIDAIAIAPYFFGCIKSASCPNANMNFLDATSVDDIFTVINQNALEDVKSLDGVIKTITDFQLSTIEKHNLDPKNSKLELITYEGGQHLVVNAVPPENRNDIRPLFNKANRDPRMNTAYLKLLSEWKAMHTRGAGLYTLYTVPRTNSDYGDFGIKDHINQAREEAPKYDAAMKFQEENQSGCWWNDCTL